MSSEACRRPCELNDICEFYWNYKDHPSVLRRLLIERYCMDEADSRTCARIRYSRDSGDSAPPALTPEGDMVSFRDALAAFGVFLPPVASTSDR